LDGWDGAKTDCKDCLAQSKNCKVAKCAA
jgi:hypothetical protein